MAWTKASIGKCDYPKDAPPDLVQAVKAAKGGIKGKDHHFTAATDRTRTLFRFGRGGQK